MKHLIPLILIVLVGCTSEQAVEIAGTPDTSFFASWLQPRNCADPNHAEYGAMVGIPYLTNLQHYAEWAAQQEGTQ